MTDWADARLLREFVRNNSEAAFTVLVERYVGLVHSVALRHTANPQHAQDITQAVFIIFARKAGSLPAKTVIPGWLHHTARLTAANLQRAEMRRINREQEAYMQSKLNEPTDNALWQELSPYLDAAIAGLGAGERDALVLRYFQNKSMAEVGQFLGLAENTAQKRVSRALEKLRLVFLKRGTSLSTIAIAGIISAKSVQAVPVGMALTVSASAVKGATAAATTLALVKGTLKIMAWTKAKTAVVVSAGILLTVGTTTIAVNKIQRHAEYSWQVERFDKKVLDQAPAMVAILPAGKRKPGSPGGPGGYGTSNGRMMGIRQPALSVVKGVYEFNTSPARVVLLTELPNGPYNYIASLPKENAQALQSEVKKVFGVVAKRKVSETNVLVLKVKPGAPALKQGVYQNVEYIQEFGRIASRSMSMFTLALSLELYFHTPVLDRTTLTGDFDIDLKWDEPDMQHRNPNGLKQALDQCGLELAPAREPVEMLVVEQAK